MVSIVRVVLGLGKKLNLQKTIPNTQLDLDGYPKNQPIPEKKHKKSRICEAGWAGIAGAGGFCSPVLTF